EGRAGDHHRVPDRFLAGGVGALAMTNTAPNVVASESSMMNLEGFGKRQSHRKVATQSHRSTERELYDSGTARIELFVKELSGPSRDTVARRRGTSCLSATRTG